jgi:hypothetical protein
MSGPASDMPESFPHEPWLVGRWMTTGGRLPLFVLSAALLACCAPPQSRGQSVASWQDANGNWHEGQPPPAANYRPTPLTQAQIQQQQQAATQVGAFPLASGSQDSALIVSLAPGAHSAEITGIGGATGIALVEVYELQ